MGSFVARFGEDKPFKTGFGNIAYITGPSAYESAVKLGFKGSEEEWLASLKGEPGKDGQDGKNGADGSPGKDGKDGEKGEPGSDGVSVSVANVTESAEDGEKNIVEFTDGKSMTVLNGKTGKPGKTPEKGTDYWTEEDQRAVINEVITKLPTWNGGSY